MTTSYAARHVAVPIHLISGSARAACGVMAAQVLGEFGTVNRADVTCPGCLHPLVAFMLARLDEVGMIEIPVHRDLVVQNCSLCPAVLLLDRTPRIGVPFAVMRPNDHSVRLQWSPRPQIWVGCPRVKRDIEGKREIIDDHMAMHSVARSSNRLLALVGEEQPDRPCTCVPMRALALPWSDHRDYRPEWSLDA